MATNTEFPKATYRHDPYPSCRFRVKWDGAYIEGITRVSALRRATQILSTDLTESSLMPGPSRFDAITIERGVTHDPAFEQWANLVAEYQSSAEQVGEEGQSGRFVARQIFHKDVILELYNEAGQKVIAYNIYRCWPSEFVAIRELDVNGDALATQSLTLQHEGWERDLAVAEPESSPEKTPGNPA